MSPVTAIRLIFFLDGLIIAKWLPHLPDIQADLDLDVGQLGLALAALPLGIMSSLPLVGTLVIAHFSERTAIRISFFWLALTSILPGLAWDLPSFAVALFFYGSGIAGVEVAMNATADAVESRVGRRIMSSCHGLWSVGNLTGAALGSLALALQLDASITLTATAPLLLVLAYVSTANLGQSPISSAPGPALALPDVPLLVLCLLPFCACVLEGAMADWAAVYLRSEHGAKAALTGAGFGVFAAIMAATRLAGDRLVDRLGPVFIARCCGISGVLGLLMLWLAPGVWAALLGFALMGLAASLIFPISVTAAAHQPGRSAAMNIASLSLICFSGYVIGPPVVGFIADQVGLRDALACLVPFALGVVLLAPRLQSRTSATVA
ncbi:MAG: MFS transporter [Candidatus Devosia phytovorans]|uniref:MFS transporter n=1 Tax=Candidatus Devosia phytovorans TaxID=3121372 RepID=A0AAJ6B1T5_9HYPH|nr:MFS transporter [Devosia sp.]WEK06637.1 MAG: MFS transporter [Devosia sp.]